MFTIHASAGKEAIKTAVKNKGKSKVVGVTVLTALGSKECKSIFGSDPEHKVLQFADLLLKEGASGIVCSAWEGARLRKFKKFKNLKIITPGIRPRWAEPNEQKRIAAPSAALEMGADYLVIGRTIASPPAKIGSPIKALNFILKEIS